MISNTDTGLAVPVASEGFSAQPPIPTIERLQFHGSGGEYFRIWIVNLLLTIITGGIYSAWAKVRKTQYLYGATQLAGSSFEYHGNPVAILKGRAIAFVLLVGYQLAFVVSKPVGILALGLFMLAMPWLVWKSLQYKLHNSSYRGIRFSFRGPLSGAYRVYLGMALLNIISLGLLSPLVHQRAKRYQHGESWFGQSRFGFHASGGAFYVRYALAMLVVMIAIGASIAAIYFGVGASLANTPKALPLKMMIGIGATYFWLFMLFPIFMTMIQNLIWSNTSLGESRFNSDMKWWMMSYLVITNLLAIVFTLGLFTPFAQIRSLRYRIQSLSLTLNENIAHFIAAPANELGATGEGLSDLIGFDISL